MRGPAWASAEDAGDRARTGQEAVGPAPHHCLKLFIFLFPTIVLWFTSSFLAILSVRIPNTCVEQPWVPETAGCSLPPPVSPCSSVPVPGRRQPPLGPQPRRRASLPRAAWLGVQGCGGQRAEPRAHHQAEKSFVSVALTAFPLRHCF